MSDKPTKRLLGIDDFNKAPALTRMAIMQRIRQFIDAGADMGLVWAGNMKPGEFQLKWGVTVEEIQQRVAVIRLAATATTASIKETGDAWKWIIEVVKRRATNQEIGK